MSRVLITGARAPVVLHLARLFHAAGHVVILADSLHFALGCATKFKAGYVRLPSPRQGLAAYGQAVMTACQAHAIDLVIPTCEEVFYLAAARDLLGVALPLFAPDIAKLRAVHDKAAFPTLAVGFGADPPETQRLDNPGDIERLGVDDWVFKPVWSRFGARVLIRPSRAQLAALHPTMADPWVAQTWLPGEELCAYAVAHHGQLAALQAYRPLYRAGKSHGAGIAVEPVADAVITAFVTGFVASQGWHGQISFDFRRDNNGALHVIECNPRSTTGTHFFAMSDGLADAVLTGATATATRTKPQAVPLAMLVYGLPQTGFSQCWQDIRRMDHMLADPDDRATWPYEILAFTGVAARAVMTGQSLTKAATADIEWNGGNFL